MIFKSGSGWKACCDENSGRCFAENGGIQAYHLFEITKEMFDRLDGGMTEWDACKITHEGRHLYMSVDDRCGPPYTIVFDDEYETLCPWAKVMKAGKVWPDELTDAAVELFESEKDNREQRRRKREEREKNGEPGQPSSDGSPQNDYEERSGSSSQLQNKMDKKTMIENVAREAYEKGGLNGAWLYAENGEVVSRGCMGFRDPGNTQPLTEDSVFQLASVSKQFTASAVVLAMRQGLLSPEDEIVKFFPEIPYPGVTVRHLLNHTSGIPDYFDDADWFIRIWEEEKRVPGNDEILRFLCETKAKPYFAPGEGLQYSNTGYNLLALLVERLTGVPYEEFLQKNIFEPAGMTSTRCCHIRRDGVPFENYAQASVYEDGRCVADVDSEEDGDVVAFDGLNGDDYVFTTLADMLRWDRVLREGRVLTAEEQQLMYTPGKLNSGEDAVYDEDYNMGYGFGWAVSREEGFGLVVSHSGGMPGVCTWFERFIDADRVLVILCNRDYADVRAYLGFEAALEAVARDKEPEPVQCIEDVVIADPDRSQWESFCGKYEHPEDDDLIIDEVWMKDGDLYAKMIDEDGDESTFRLYPIGENEFGRKQGTVKLKFGDGCMTYVGLTCKKL